MAYTVTIVVEQNDSNSESLCAALDCLAEALDYDMTQAWSILAYESGNPKPLFDKSRDEDELEDTKGADEEC